MLDESNPPFSTCIRCATCDGFPCLVHAKSDAEVWVRPALEHSNVTLLNNAQVVTLDTNAEGTAVTEVVVERDGVEERFGGDVVVAACGAANTAKLLLGSASDKHPNGLANGSDQVGRNYMFHDDRAVLALSREENHTAYQKTLGATTSTSARTESSTRWGNVQMVGKSTAPMFRGERPRDTKLAPEWNVRHGATRSTSGSRPRTSRDPRTGSRSTATASHAEDMETNAGAKKRLYGKFKSLTMGSST